MASEDEEHGEDGGEGAEDTLGAYEGERNFDSERHGMGFALLPNGDMYDGMYRHGKRHGKGLYVFRNGARYNGNYRYGMKQGVGLFIYPDGSQYEGEWKKDMKHGFGIYRYTNGDTYEGSWYKGLRDGLGVYFYKSLNVKYSGTWEKGRMHGPAQVIYPPFRYHGDWKNGLPLGKGTFTFEAETMQIGGYINIKDPEFVPEEKEEVPPPPPPPSPPPVEGVPEGEEIEVAEPLPKGLIPVWRPKQYLPFTPEKMPRSPIPKERPPSPTTSKDKLFEEDESSFFGEVDEDLEGYCLDQDLTEILYYFLDLEVKLAMEYAWDRMSADDLDIEIIRAFGGESEAEGSLRQQRELICGPSTDRSTDEEEDEGEVEKDTIFDDSEEEGDGEEGGTE